jgi:hypothetical protein
LDSKKGPTKETRRGIYHLLGPYHVSSLCQLAITVPVWHMIDMEGQKSNKTEPGSVQWSYEFSLHFISVPEFCGVFFLFILPLTDFWRDFTIFDSC